MTSKSTIGQHGQPLLVDDEETGASPNNSPEAAGIARGTARAATATATATGTTTATTTATAAARVARASERISTGLNIYDATAKTTTTTATSAANAAMGGGKALEEASVTLSKRVMVGRLPKKAVPKATTAAGKISIKGGGGRIATRTGGSGTVRSAVRRPSVPKRMPRRLRLQRVAKASDRLSTTFDIYEAASASTTTNDTSTNDSRSTKEMTRNHRNNFWFDIKRVKKQIGQVFLFSETLVKNTIVGAATFGTYEKVISDFDNFPDNHSTIVSTTVSETDGKEIHNKTDSNTNTNFIREDSFSRTSVMQHFGAGLCAGSVHGFLSIVAETCHYVYQNRGSLFLNYNPRKTRVSFKKKFLQPIQWSARYITHHSLAHSILFSSYEVSKRSLMSLNDDNSNDTVRKVKGRKNNDIESYLPSYFWVRDISIIGMSGGFAGQIQHIVSHYSENSLNVSEENFFQSDCGKGNIQKKQLLVNNGHLIRSMVKKYISRGPSSRSVMLSFFPSAVGFVAFEFGKELIS